MGDAIPLEQPYFKSKQARLINFTGAYHPEELISDSLNTDSKEHDPDQDILKRIGQFLFIPSIMLCISTGLILASVTMVKLF